jgi:hypothetical protein
MARSIGSAGIATLKKFLRLEMPKEEEKIQSRSGDIGVVVPKKEESPCRQTSKKGGAPGKECEMTRGDVMEGSGILREGAVEPAGRGGVPERRTSAVGTASGEESGVAGRHASKTLSEAQESGGLAVGGRRLGVAKIIEAQEYARSIVAWKPECGAAELLENWSRERGELDEKQEEKLADTQQRKFAQERSAEERHEKNLASDYAEEREKKIAEERHVEFPEQRRKLGTNSHTKKFSGKRCAALERRRKKRVKKPPWQSKCGERGLVQRRVTA